MEAHRITDGASMKNFLDIIFKRKGQVVLFFTAIVCTVAVATFMMQPKFEASAQILVKLGRESVFIPTSENAGPIINLDRENRINTEIAILKSNTLAEKVLEIMGPGIVYGRPAQQQSGILGRLKKKLKIYFRKLEDLLAAPQRAALSLETELSKFQKDLKVQNIKKSNVIEISFEHQDPKIAAIVVNKLTESYLERHLAIHKVSQSHEFFQQQAEVLKNKVQHTEDRLKALKKQHNVTSLEEQRTLLLGQESELQTDLNRTKSQVAETEKRIRQIRQQLAATPKTIPREAEVDQNPYVISSLEARLVELELKEKKLLTQYTDQSRLVSNVQDEIRMVREKLADQNQRSYERKTSGVNPTYQHLSESLYDNEASINALKAKSETQKDQLAVYQSKLDDLNQIEMELNRLKQELEIDRKNYQRYLAKFEETRISAAMDSQKISNVTLIEPARIPMKPVKPKVFLNLILAALVGVLGGMGLVFVLEHLDDSLKRPEDVENYLGLPVLASIPDFK
jgi:uncharacterized protein involved in exopolysaccharide biosynthesis